MVHQDPHHQEETLRLVYAHILLTAINGTIERLISDMTALDTFLN